MNHIAVLYTFDLILLDFAEYPLRERNSERGKDGTVVVYLALHDPGMGVGQVGVVAADIAAETDQQRVDRICAACDKADSPGCALGVIRDGEFIHRKAAGATPSRAVMVRRHRPLKPAEAFASLFGSFIGNMAQSDPSKTYMSGYLRCNSSQNHRQDSTRPE
jgi:hypothetical protein